MLRQVAHLFGHTPMLPHRVMAEHAHFPGICAQQAAHQTDGRGLARSVGADQPEHLATMYLQRQGVQGMGRPVPLRDPAQFDGGAHGPPSLLGCGGAPDSCSSASTGMPDLSTPALLSTATLIR